MLARQTLYWLDCLPSFSFPNVTVEGTFSALSLFSLLIFWSRSDDRLSLIDEELKKPRHTEVLQSMTEQGFRPRQSSWTALYVTLPYCLSSWVHTKRRTASQCLSLPSVCVVAWGRMTPIGPYVSGTVWEGLGDVALLEEVCPWVCVQVSNIWADMSKYHTALPFYWPSQSIWL